MAKRNQTKSKEEIVTTLNVGLTEDLDKRLNAFCLKEVEKTGKVEWGRRTAIMREALTEWLDKNEPKTKET